MAFPMEPGLTCDPRAVPQVNPCAQKEEKTSCQRLQADKEQQEWFTAPLLPGPWGAAHRACGGAGSSVSWAQGIDPALQQTFTAPDMGHVLGQCPMPGPQGPVGEARKGAQG